MAPIETSFREHPAQVHEIIRHEPADSETRRAAAGPRETTIQRLPADTMPTALRLRTSDGFRASPARTPLAREHMMAAFKNEWASASRPTRIVALLSVTGLTPALEAKAHALIVEVNKSARTPSPEAQRAVDASIAAFDSALSTPVQRARLADALHRQPGFSLAK